MRNFHYYIQPKSTQPLRNFHHFEVEINDDEDLLMNECVISIGSDDEDIKIISTEESRMILRKCEIILNDLNDF